MLITRGEERGYDMTSPQYCTQSVFFPQDASFALPAAVARTAHFVHRKEGPTVQSVGVSLTAGCRNKHPEMQLASTRYSGHELRRSNFEVTGMPRHCAATFTGLQGHATCRLQAQYHDNSC